MRNFSKAVPRQTLVEQSVSARTGSPIKLSTTDLNNLMQTIDIDVIALIEVLVPQGHRVEMEKMDAPGIHYNLNGAGRISFNGGPQIPLSPHLLIIVPPNSPFAIEVDDGNGHPRIISRNCWTRQDNILRIAVPNEKPEIIQICGYFNAIFGQSVKLFGELREPVIEQFEPADRIDLKLREAMDELLQQEVGAGAMTSSLIKQILISLLRRSLRSSQQWAERFSILADRQITRAFADMVARPGAAHSVHSLARSAGLSRSGFMARFSDIFGQSPMVTLRDLRMRQAATELTTTSMPVDVIAQNAGYSSRSSFVRAFRQAYDRDPSEYRQIGKDGDGQ